MRAWLQQVGEGLLDLLFPPLCVACRAHAPRHLCDACLETMPRLQPPLCRRCGAPLLLPETSPAPQSTLCSDCHHWENACTACRAYGAFADPLRLAIHAVKYRGKTAVIPALADLLAQTLSEEPILHPARILVPVPLHPRRQRQRGFNQSVLLARALAQKTGLEVREDLLQKVRHTHPQVRLNAAQRRENLRDAFRVPDVVLPSAPLLLIDDVTTTGATFHECARVLRDAGARRVFALALAHD